MQIVKTDDILNNAGLASPQLRALIPNEANYSVMLLQPNGDLEADANGVRHRNAPLAIQQFSSFLADVRQGSIDLVITPEYSTPWNAIRDIITSDRGPGEGALWCLGCESVKYAELEQLKQDLSALALFLYEPLQPDAQRFLNPLLYLFRTTNRHTGASCLVALVQFKTFPMAGDNDHFEINGMARGSTIYAFGGTDEQIRLVSLICSDVLDFTDPHAAQIYDRAIVLHIQLNPKPRQTQFRQYRSKLFRTKDDVTELLCVNWAKDVNMTFKGASTCWHNVAGTVWYLRPRDFDGRDPALVSNHRGGMYYTWCPSLRTHVMFFNCAPAAFLLTATKVFHRNVVAVQSRRIGPRLTTMFGWDATSARWVPAAPDDNFAALLSSSGAALTELQSLASNNPFNAERVLALSAGQLGGKDRWHDVQELDSCTILECETIRRVTFCQDSEPDALQFRQQRVNRLRRLWEEILPVAVHLPTSLIDLQVGKTLAWTPDAPHQNLLTPSGKRATAIYLGEDVTVDQAMNVKTEVAEYLRRASRDHDHEVESKQRLAVWFRNGNGTIELAGRDQYIRFDEPRTGSPVDVARTT
ncbi:MAG: hypothetical protein GDA67_15515 [Nitrospira sp. CR1.3]|nr:hypothetical protein [Nitrospira sp. CR1.3]